MLHDQTAGPQTDKIQLGRESKMAADTKNSKTIKINFFSRKSLVFLAKILYGVLEGPWCSVVSKGRKIYSGLRSQGLFKNLRQP